jgi:hypothetical protein
MNMNAIYRSAVAASCFLATTVASADERPALQVTDPSGVDLDDGSLPAGFSCWREVMAAQEPLMRAVAEIEAFLGTELPSKGLEPPGFSGFAAIEVDVSTSQVTVYWKGEAPPTVLPFLGRLETRYDVNFLLATAAFSRAELDRELMQVIRERGETGLVGMGRLPKGAGLFAEVEGSPTRATRASVFVDATARLAALRSALSAEEGPQFVIRRGARSVASSRDSDTTPFFGGSRMVLSNASTSRDCSSGFAVVDGSSLSYILTAAHCSDFQTSWLVRNGTRTSPMGFVFSIDSDTDSALIHVPSSGPRIYAGGVSFTDETTRKVLAETSSVPGMFACGSGAFSGERCNASVKAIDEFRIIQGEVVGPMVRAERDDHLGIVGAGDSGGPVYFPIGADFLFAMGTIVAGDPSASAPCTGQFFPPRDCSFRMFYSPINNSLAAQHVHLKTQ